MYDAEQIKLIDSAIRGMAAASKSLRLYPPTSPIPKEAVQTALAPLLEFLTTEPSLRLSVVRDGLAAGPQPVGANVPGATELSDVLRHHDVAELEIRPGVNVHELVTFLGALNRRPEEVRSEGGLTALLVGEGVESIRLTRVVLSVATGARPEADDEVDEFLRELALDPTRLSTWIAVASQNDASTFADGLAELADAAGGAGGVGGAEGASFGSSLSRAFETLDAVSRDALFGLAMEGRDPGGVVGDALGLLQADQLAEALCGGSYGANLLSLSSAVARLPLEGQLDGVLQHVRGHCLEQGHSDAELGFFDRMVGLRATGEPEAALVETDGGFVAVAATEVARDEVEASRGEIRSALAAGSRRTVQTLLALLDQQNDYSLYCRTLDRLASLTKRLIQQGELVLADRVLMEMDNRSGSVDRPWADLGERIRKAIAAATGAEAMQGVLDRVARSDEDLDAAKRIVRHGGETAEHAVVSCALAGSDTACLDAAARLLGARLSDCLAVAAPHAPVAHLAEIAGRLASAGDARAVAALDTLVRRPEHDVRREVAKGLGGSGALGTRFLERLLKDPSPQVAMAAARSLGDTPSAHTAEVLADRLSDLDVDGDEFQVAAEIMRSLGRVGRREATSTLKRLAKRRAIFKRGHFSEVQQLAREALDALYQRPEPKPGDNDEGSSPG